MSESGQQDLTPMAQQIAILQQQLQAAERRERTLRAVLAEAEAQIALFKQVQMEGIDNVLKDIAALKAAAPVLLGYVSDDAAIELRQPYTLTGITVSKVKRVLGDEYPHAIYLDPEPKA